MPGTLSPVSSEEELDVLQHKKHHEIGPMSERRRMALINRTPITERTEWTAQGIGSFHHGILDSRLTFTSFVELKFVPDHVDHKTRSGRTHYQAMLKHVITPETVNRIFRTTAKKKITLKTIPDWPYLDHVRLCDITAAHVGRIISAANNKGYSSQTVKHLKNVIGAIISHAQKEGCFSGRNPAAEVRLSPVRHNRRSALTLRELSIVLQRMQYPEKEMALMAMFTGLSISDICQLRWKQVNLAASPLVFGDELIPAFTIAIKKSWDHNSVGTSAGGRSKTVEISDALIPVLLGIKSRSHRVGPDDFVVTAPNGARIVNANTRIAKLKHMAASLGIPLLNWNSFRKLHNLLIPELLYRSMYSSHPPTECFLLNWLPD